jgi:Tfp pilus assembly protein PilN
VEDRRVKRINYLESWSERRIGIALPSAISPSLRAPLAVLACSLALVFVLWSVQQARLHAAQRDGESYARRLAMLEADLARVRAAQREVAAMRDLAGRLDALHRSGSRQADDIAALGNRLPDDAWLTALRVDRTGFEMQGRAARMASIGRTLAELARLSAYGGTRLISARDEAARGGVTYAIALERRQ